MRAVEPEKLHEGGTRVVLGIGQDEYLPLVASMSVDGMVMTEWEPSAEDLARLLDGGRVRIWLQTFGHGFPPINVEVAGTREGG